MSADAVSAAAKRFEEACARWDSGDHRGAFRRFLIGAKAGDVSSQLNVGLFYDEGIGVRKDGKKALHWYRRAHRGGSTSAAVNIGILLRDQGSLAAARQWFERAVKRGNDDANLQLAEAFLQTGDTRRARRCLMKVVKSDKVTEETQRQARRYLQKIAV